MSESKGPLASIILVELWTWHSLHALAARWVASVKSAPMVWGQAGVSASVAGCGFAPISSLVTTPNRARASDLPRRKKPLQNQPPPPPKKQPPRKHRICWPMQIPKSSSATYTKWPAPPGKTKKASTSTNGSNKVQPQFQRVDGSWVPHPPLSEGAGLDETQPTPQRRARSIS